MTAYLMLCVGEDHESAEPILITDDPAIVAATIDALLERMGHLTGSKEPPAG